MIIVIQYMEIKLAELNNQINNSYKKGFNELIKFLNNTFKIETKLGIFILKINVNIFTDNKTYEIRGFLRNQDNSIPLLEHLEPTGEICWRKSNRFESSIINAFLSIKKIVNLFSEITTYVNYDNILSEFNLYINYNYEHIDNKRFWIINPQFKEENIVLINKNIIYVNFEEPIFNNAINNFNKTDYSGLRKQVIHNIEIQISDFQNTRNIEDVLQKYKERFFENSFHIVWICSRNKKFPIIINYKQGTFIYQYHFKILNKENIDMKNGNCDGKKINEKWNFVLIGTGAVGSYLLELLSSLKPKSITIVDGDIFSFENIQRHLLDTIEIDNDLDFKYKNELLFKRILKKFNYKIQTFNEKLKCNNIDNLLSSLDNMKQLDMTVFINCTGEANITALLFNKLQNYNKNKIYISSLFLDSEYTLLDKKDMFFIENWNENKMKEFLDGWTSSKSGNSEYLCTSFNVFSLVDIFELISTYIRELIEKCK